MQKQASPEKSKKEEEVKKDPATLLEEALNDSADNSPRNLQQDKKKKWGNQWQKTKDAAPLNGLANDADDSEMSRQLHVKENKLPRWAQSVTGEQLGEESRITGISRQTTMKAEEEKKAHLEKMKNQMQQQLDSEKNGEDIEEIFSNTLEKTNS